jgi:hypothetical protein
MVITSKTGNRWFQLILVCFALMPSIAYTQASKDQKKAFAEAETFFLYEDYDLALKQYLTLDAPDNFNIKYKIGTCYLNLPGEKEKSVPYLETAAKNVSFESKTASLSEKKAPVDALFFLSKAYMVNNVPEKALTTLQSLQVMTKALPEGKGVRNREYIDQQIEACNNLILLRETPVSFTRELAGKNISNGLANFNPAVSFDGNTLVFTERSGAVNTILMSKKGENGKWQQPTDITAQLKAGSDCSSCSLNSDGTELYVYKIGNFDGSIYSSTFENGKWLPLKELNNNINTKYYESHASVSADGKKLYFTSNRAGGMGNLDIYVSKREDKGSWGPAVNLGPTINSEFNEDTPFVTKNDSILYFSSEGHRTIGGFDIFKSKEKAGTWDDPVNLGYPFNTPDDDKFFQPVNDGRNGYYSFIGDTRKEEIYYFTFESPVKPDLKSEPTVNKPSFVIASKPEDATEKALSPIRRMSAAETSKIDTTLTVIDESDKNVKDTEVLYFTVQLMALHNPVDISYFKNVTNVKVIYNDNDKFFRYTSGKFHTREEAELLKSELMEKGYPREIFIKKVIKQ